MARFSVFVLALAFGTAFAFAPRTHTQSAVRMSAVDDAAKATAAGLAAALALGAVAPPAQAITAAERAQLSYLQVGKWPTHNLAYYSNVSHVFCPHKPIDFQ